jgi:5-(carboxyamino)imidazole ribonucleotide synthase
MEKIPLKKLHNAKMENLIGNQITPYRQNIKLNENQFFFDYLKKEIKDKRKMGHITTII